MQKIFVATDFSAAADEAIRQAHDRARQAGAKLFACHVIPALEPIDSLLPAWNPDVAGSLEELREQSVEGLTSRVAQLTERKKEEFEILIGEGDVASFIVRKAKEVDAKLLVIGSFGSSGLTRILLGSVAENVVRHAHCPVLLTRSHEKTGMILVATDFSDSSLPAVEAAAKEAKRSGSRIALLHSIDNLWLSIGYAEYGIPGATMNPAEILPDIRKQISQKLETILQTHKMPAEKIVEEGPAVSAIVGAAERLNADLVIVGSIGRSGLPRLMLGSVAEGVARSVSCSVLIVRLHRA